MITEELFNALKSKARECSAEIQAEIDRKAKYDDVAGPIINKHYEKVKPLCSRIVFMWVIGKVNGRFADHWE
ncbi:hypothetical protein vBSlqSZDD2_25 [Serratia phage vB_SlqS_ZDD2]|nr:hypothetical protein vBSlqSZDD2_25 [Serratia phage vB_SlqS_ZDD2]